MSSSNKKAYVYQMNLVPANIFSLFILVLVAVPTFFLHGFDGLQLDWMILFFLTILWLMFHEFWHGVGYYLGGTKLKNIAYGICLDKGIFYCMSYQEVSKKNIQISLLFPFFVIGVFTYIIGMIFHFPVLVILSVFNIMGASMDLAMFFFFLRLPKDMIYSESGQGDQFVVISNQDLTKKKSIFVRIIEEKEYRKEDYIFPNVKRFTITKFSIIFFVIYFLLIVLSFFL